MEKKNETMPTSIRINKKQADAIKELEEKYNITQSNILRFCISYTLRTVFKMKLNGELK